MVLRPRISPGLPLSEFSPALGLSAGCFHLLMLTIYQDRCLANSTEILQNPELNYKRGTPQLR